MRKDGTGFNSRFLGVRMLYYHYKASLSLRPDSLQLLRRITLSQSCMMGCSFEDFLKIFQCPLSCLTAPKSVLKLLSSLQWWSPNRISGRDCSFLHAEKKLKIFPKGEAGIENLWQIEFMLVQFQIHSNCLMSQQVILIGAVIGNHEQNETRWHSSCVTVRSTPTHT